MPPIDEAFLAAIEASPEHNARLMTKNVAMSTATELVHLASGKSRLAAASAMTRDRSSVLLLALLRREMPGLAGAVEGLLGAVQPWVMTDANEGEGSGAVLTPPVGADQEWVEFTQEWGYNAQQREAIRVELSRVLSLVNTSKEE